MPKGTQDSPKVPVKWPTIELHRKTSRGGLPGLRGWPTSNPGSVRGEVESETYIPLSALLSDEVEEAVAKWLDRKREAHDDHCGANNATEAEEKAREGECEGPSERLPSERYGGFESVRRWPEEDRAGGKDQ